MTIQLSRRAQLGLADAAIALAGIGACYGIAQLQGSGTAPQQATEGGRKVLYWYDPMVPSQHFDKPGKSPFMDMQLVPKYADEAVGDAGARTDPARVQNLGITVYGADRGPPARG